MEKSFVIFDFPAQVFTPGKCGILDTSNYDYYTVLYCSWLAYYNF